MPAPRLRTWADLKKQWKSSDLAIFEQRLSAVYHAFVAVKAKKYPRSAVRNLVHQMRRALRWLMLDIWLDRRLIDDPGWTGPF